MCRGDRNRTVLWTRPSSVPLRSRSLCCTTSRGPLRSIRSRLKSRGGVMGRTYRGRRVDHVCSVDVNGVPLNPRFDLRNHSPDGFNWGYGGSGPAQLSLALLADATGEPDTATRLYQEFKRRHIAGIEA